MVRSTPDIKEVISYTVIIALLFKGKIMGAQYHLYKNAGWNSDFSPDIMATAMLHLDGSYEFPSFL